MAIDINGDGLIAVGGTSTTQGRVRLAEDTDNGTNYVELTANAAITTNRTVTFPDENIDFTTGLSATLGGTGLTSAGTNGNVLTSNGTAWVSQAAAAGGGDYIMNIYAGPSTGTWTKPAGLKAVKVTVVGGGGSSGAAIPTPVGQNTQGGGGAGGAAIEYIDAPALPGPQPYTAGGAAGTSSFGSPAFLSATGGSTGGGTGGPSPGYTGVSGGAGGTGSGGQLNITGGGGGSGIVTAICGNGNGMGGVGGSSIFGAGGQAGGGGNNAGGFTAQGVAGSNYGGGGGGGAKIIGGPGAVSQTAGGVGVVIVEEFY